MVAHDLFDHVDRAFELVDGDELVGLVRHVDVSGAEHERSHAETRKVAAVRREGRCAKLSPGLTTRPTATSPLAQGVRPRAHPTIRARVNAHSGVLSAGA